ncbi:MAG: hypothetical protein EOP14_00490 [Pseudomonas sp.]|nr:MAG: hypothetical protein EOP14_00490 [Pseudomonas sp.]
MGSQITSVYVAIFLISVVLVGLLFRNLLHVFNKWNTGGPGGNNKSHAVGKRASIDRRSLKAENIRKLFSIAGPPPTAKEIAYLKNRAETLNWIFGGLAILWLLTGSWAVGGAVWDWLLPDGKMEIEDFLATATGFLFAVVLSFLSAIAPSLLAWNFVGSLNESLQLFDVLTDGRADEVKRLSEKHEAVDKYRLKVIANRVILYGDWLAMHEYDVNYEETLKAPPLPAPVNTLELVHKPDSLYNRTIDKDATD